MTEAFNLRGKTSFGFLKPVSRETHDIEVVATYAFDQGAPACLKKLRMKNAFYIIWSIWHLIENVFDLYAITPCLVERFPSGNICSDHLHRCRVCIDKRFGLLSARAMDHLYAEFELTISLDKILKAPPRSVWQTQRLCLQRRMCAEPDEKKTNSEKWEIKISHSQMI